MARGSWSISTPYVSHLLVKHLLVGKEEGDRNSKALLPFHEQLWQLEDSPQSKEIHVLVTGSGST